MQMRKPIMLQYQLCFVISLIFTATQLPTINAQSSGISSSSVVCSACHFRGIDIEPGVEVQVDECTTCTCVNSTIKCTHKSCPFVYCDEPVRFDNECCDLCPYYVPIYEITATELNTKTKKKVNNVIFDLNMKINRAGTDVSGQGLWKLGVWGSCNADGEGERISYQEQVLTENQAATDLIRPHQNYDGFEFNITNIAVSLDRTGGSCSEMGFVCYELKTGDNPDLKDLRLTPFSIEGVAGEDDLIPAPKNLKGCVSKYSADNPKTCIYEGTTFYHGEELIIDECMTVICDYGVVKQDVESCPPVICDSTIKIEGKCCKRCPYSPKTLYHLPIYEINARSTKRKVNVIVFDLNVNVNSAGTGVIGHWLYKLSVWGSASDDGGGQRISYQDQVLTEEQQAIGLFRIGTFVSGFEFNIRNIAYSLDGTDATCSDMQFLCYEFNKGDNPDLSDSRGRLEYIVEGVAGEFDLTPAPQNLRGCVRFTKCILSTFTISETNACLINGSVVDGRTSNPYKINYNMIMGDGITVEEQGLWQLTAYGSATADGSGDKLNPTTETLDASQASMKFTPGKFVYFGKVDFDISMQGQTCDTVQYVCVELGIGSGWDEQFAVNGIEKNALRSCVHAFCEDTSFSENTLEDRSKN